MATINECFEIGKILRPVGLFGEVIIHLFTQESSYYNKLKTIYCYQSGNLFPLSVKKWELSTKRGNFLSHAKFEDYNTTLEVEHLKGALLYLPNNKLPVLEDNQFYYHEIVGFTVIDDKLGKLGLVDEIFEVTGNDLFSMQYQGHEVLIPLCKEITLSCDKEKKELNVSLPDGLLDIYLDS